MVVKVDGKNLLFDSGSGTLRGLLWAGMTYQDIDHIFYSHLHPDHTLDLVSILFASKNPSDPRCKDLPITGPRGIRSFYNGLLSSYGDSIQVASCKVLVEEVWDSRIEYEGLRLITKPLAHSDSSIGYRVESKAHKSLAYSGDTDYCQNVVELARDVDLLVLECSFPNEERVEGHLTPSLARRIAKESNARKLLLTHLYPICDEYDILAECKGGYEGDVILAQDLMRLEI